METINLSLSVISLILGVLTLLGLLYQFAYRNAITDKTLRDFKDLLDKYSLAEISNQVNTMWEVYVLDALHSRPDLAKHNSPLQITDEGEAMIPQYIKDVLLSYHPDPYKNQSATWIVVSCLGTLKISELATELKLSTSITLSLLSVFYRKYHPETKLDTPTCDSNKPTAVAA